MHSKGNQEPSCRSSDNDGKTQKGARITKEKKCIRDRFFENGKHVDETKTCEQWDDFATH